MSTHSRGIALLAMGIRQSGQLPDPTASQPRKRPQRSKRLGRPPSKLTDQQVIEILRRHDEQGQPAHLIARDMGLDRGLVRGVTYGGCGTRTVWLCR